MKIQRYTLKNYRCFRDQMIWIPKCDLNIIVGENNSGKSTLFKFLKQVHSITNFDDTNFSIDEWYNRHTKENVDFEIEYLISETFLEKLNNLREETEISTQDVINYIFRDLPVDSDLDPNGTSTRERIWSIAEVLRKMYSEIKDQEYSVDDIQNQIVELLEDYHGLHFKEFDYKTQNAVTNSPYFDLLASMIFYSYKIKSNNLLMNASIKHKSHTNPSIEIDNFIRQRHSWNLKKDHSGIYNEIQNYRKILHNYLVSVERAINSHLTSSLVVIEEIRMRSKVEKAKVYKCSDGRDLANVLYTLSLDINPENRDKYSKIKDAFQSFYPNYEFAVVEVDSQQLKIQVIDKIRKIPFTLEEYGTGMMDILIILTNLITIEDKIIIIEEPETHIHPIFQRKLMKIIEHAGEKNQIFLTTHSPSFISFNNLESIVRLAQIEKSSYLYPFNMDSLLEQKNQRFTKKPCDESTIRTRYSKILTSQVKNAFFAKGVILVEGETEKLSLPIWSRYLNFDLDAHSIEIVNCYSKFNIIDIGELLKMYNIPLFIIFDADNPDDKNHSKQNKWLKSFLGYENPEEIFEESNIGSVSCIFVPKYENALVISDPDYSKIEKDVIQENKFRNEDGQKGLKAYYSALEYQNTGKNPPMIITDLISAIKTFFT